LATIIILRIIVHTLAAAIATMESNSDTMSGPIWINGISPSTQVHIWYKQKVTSIDHLVQTYSTNRISRGNVVSSKFHQNCKTTAITFPNSQNFEMLNSWLRSWLRKLNIYIIIMATSKCKISTVNGSRLFRTNCYKTCLEFLKVNRIKLYSASVWFTSRAIWIKIILNFKQISWSAFLF